MALAAHESSASAAWSDTLGLLDRELRLLAASGVVIGCGPREQDIHFGHDNAR